MSIRLLLADHHELICHGIRGLLAGEGFEVIAQASCAESTLPLTEELNPDIVLLDVRLPMKAGRGRDCAGFDVLADLLDKNPDRCVVVYSACDNPTYVARSIAWNARDYLQKNAGREETISLLRGAMTDDGVRSPLYQKIASLMGSRQAIDEMDVSITPRESQVVRHVALGLSNREIGRSLGISVETVKEHVQNILRKIPVADRTQAAVWAVRRGIV